MNRQTMNGFMAILSILVLIIPIGVSGYVQEKTESNIIEIQGSYTDGDTIGLYDGSTNLTELVSAWTPTYSYDNPLGWDANNDTIFQGYKSSGVLSDRDGTFYGNYNTYTGSGNHTTTMDWNDVPVGTYNSLRYIYIPTNYTCSDLAEYDFFKFHSTIDTTSTINYRVYFENGYGSLDEIQLVNVDDDTKMGIISYSLKNAMNGNPNGTVYIGFSAGGTNFDETQTSFTWMVETFVLEPDDYVFGSEFSDFTIWIALMVSLDAIYLYVMVFANPWFDTKFDHKWRK